MLDRELDVVNRGIEDDADPFIEVDECMELEGLIDKTGGDSCTVDEFLTGDSDLPVCVEMDDDNWDAAIIEGLGMIRVKKYPVEIAMMKMAQLTKKNPPSYKVTKRL